MKVTITPKEVRMKRLLLPLLFLLLISTTSAQRPDRAHSVQPADTLKGMKALSVNVFVEGISDIPESAYRSDIEGPLRAAGATILPATIDPKTYPSLTLYVKGRFMEKANGGLAGSIVTWSLELQQLFPQRAGSQTMYVRGTTWESGCGFAWGPSTQIVSILRKGYTDTIAEFVQDYKKANLSK
jgi:hypothetical protein